MNEWEWQLLEDKSPVETVEIAGVTVRVGDRVQACVRAKAVTCWTSRWRAKPLPSKPSSRTTKAKIHVCVVLDDDPGRDMGLLRQPGHRFFFDVDEVEPLPPEEQARREGR